MPSTLKDIAREANVHYTLVSKLINKTPGFYIRSETRARVEAALKKLHYHPMRSARALRTGYTNMLGLVTGNLTNEYFAHYADEAIKVAEKLGYRLLISVCRDSDPDPCIRDLEANQVSAIVCCDLFHPHYKAACPIYPEHPFAAAEMTKAVDEAAIFLKVNGCSSVIGLYVAERWKNILKKSVLGKTLESRFEKIELDMESRLFQVRKICERRPNAIISSGWQTAQLICEIVKKDFLGYSPKIIVWTNCRGPYLSEPYIAGVLHTSTRKTIAEMFSALVAEIPKGAKAAPRVVSPCSFIPRGTKEYDALPADNFCLT